MPPLVVLAAAALAAALPDPPPAPPAAADAPAVRVRIVPAAPATPVPAGAAATPQPLICKSSIVTGSLIARRKQCLTKAQWRYVDDVQRQQTQQLFDDQRTKAGCTVAATC